MKQEIYYILNEKLSCLVYPDNLPEGTNENACVYSISQFNDDGSFDGPSGVLHGEVKAELAGMDDAEIDELATILSTELDGYRGLMLTKYGIWTLMDDESNSVWLYGDMWLAVRTLTFNVQILMPQHIIVHREFSSAFSNDFANRNCVIDA